MLVNIRHIYNTKVDSDFISWEEYKKIIYLFIRFMVKKIFEGESITLPFRMGKLYVIGKKIKPKFVDGKIKGLAPDWKSTKELWDRDTDAKKNKTLVYFLNEETNNIRYRFFYSKYNATMKNKFSYRFILSRANKRELAKIIKTGKEFLIKK